MGFLGSVASSDVKEMFPGQERGRRLWDAAFGGVSKEDAHKQPPARPGGTHGRSTLSSTASVVRLVQAMRSMAPGGWSDDRWAQTRAYRGINYVGIDRTGRQLAQAEFQVFRKDKNHPDGKHPVKEDDPPEGDRFVKPYDLVKLLERPNNQDSFGKMLWRTKQQLGLTGTALWWMMPNELGTPMELYVIPTAIAIPQPAINPDFPDGFYRIQPVYPYGPFSSYPTPSTAVGAPIAAQWMLRFQYPHPLLRYDGFSPLTGMNLEVDEFESIGRSRWYAMKREQRPSAVLNFDKMEGMEPLPEAEIERIRAEFENNFQGQENVGKLYVATPGAELEPWGTNPKEMDYPNSWDQLASFILGGGFGITKPAAGMGEASSYANLWASIKQLHWTTLDPDCADVAADLTRHLAPFFGDDLIVEIRCKRIDDHDLVLQKIDKGITARCITKNQVLKLLDLPVTSEKWGNEIAGSESQEGAMPAMPGLPPMGGAPPPMGAPPMPTPEKEMAQGQPVPGPISQGALGPRKDLTKALGMVKRKSLYDQVREVCHNGSR